MKGHGSKYDRKWEQAIAALLAHKSLEEAARIVGVNANTLSRWKKNPEFDAAYREARSAAFSQSMGRLQDAAGAAASTVLMIMTEPKTPPGTRLRAAEIVLNQAAKAAEIEEREDTELEAPRTAASAESPGVHRKPLEIEAVPSSPIREDHISAAFADGAKAEEDAA